MRLALGAAWALAGPAPALWAATAFQESGGQVVMEAERYDAKIPRSGHDWVLQTAQSGYAGSGYLTALPNAGANINTGYTTTSPELVYNACFATPGTYSVWIRGAAASGTEDSVHAGLDGMDPASADRITGFSTSWAWKRATMDSDPATVVVSAPGLHTIHLWMREDGVQVDKILLRTGTTSPSGTGPAESARGACGEPDTTAPVITFTWPKDDDILVAP